MDKKYYCITCNYSSYRLYDFNRHKKSKKHISNQQANFDAEICTRHKTDESRHKNDEVRHKNDEFCAQFSDDDFEKGFTCDHCLKYFLDKSNRVRHIKNCKVKIQKEDKKKQNKLLLKKDEIIKKKEQISKQLNEENEKLKQEIKDIEKEYLEFMKEMATKQVSTTINNSNTVNMYYIINNYKNAYNYEELMKKPLTDAEIDYINKKGAIAGCYNLIENRCIRGVEIEKRPFHCVDDARSKYLLRENDDWSVDKKGFKILSEAFPKIRDAYLMGENDEFESQINSINQLMNMELKGKTKIINELNKVALLKNNIR